MISYKQALQILKKSSITIKDETINSKNAVNRVLSSTLSHPPNILQLTMQLLMDLLSDQKILKA